MTDLVVGGGAVGSLIAWGLARGGRDVAIVRRRLDGPARPATVTVVGRTGERGDAAVTEVRGPADLASAITPSIWDHCVGRPCFHPGME